jgi:hypothetical protein
MSKYEGFDPDAMNQAFEESNPEADKAIRDQEGKLKRQQEIQKAVEDLISPPELKGDEDKDKKDKTGNPE